MTEKYMRPIRSFVLRQGRLTKGQEQALKRVWPIYGIEEGDSVLELESIFNKSGSITLEIGFGNGDSLASMAKSSPGDNFIGIEVHKPGIGHLLHLIDEYNLENVRVMNGDAVEIFENRVPDSSIDRVQLFFPDPWHKKKHNKRRIVQPEFVSMVASKLKNGGVFHLATDWGPYAEHMAEVLGSSNEFKSISDAPFTIRPDSRPITKFEKRGMKLGHAVWDLLYKHV